MRVMLAHPARRDPGTQGAEGRTAAMTVHMSWREDVACRDADPDLFFPISTTEAGQRQMEEAKRICRDCPAQIQCLAWAVENAVTDGVWGGTTPDERRVMRSLSRKTTTTQADGDDKSYHPAERREHGIRAQAAPVRLNSPYPTFAP
jgi:WhiB family transcriptional regulator, redox-sensing transcriptional regulator